MKKFVISTHGFDMGIGGLKVLHKLCHELNERGHDAYLVPVHFDHPFAIYEKYNVKLITQDILDNLQDCVVVYPESWFGNYLNAPNVVRWMIGPPGEDHVVTWSEKDLWFWFIPYYITGQFTKNTDNFLYVDEKHRDIFYDKQLPRNGSCWTLRKAKVTENDFVHPIGDFIPYHAAGDLEGLSQLFNSRESFYCYDQYTYLTIQSLFCNTDAIVVPGTDGSQKDFLNGYELNRYVAYGEKDLPRARNIRNELWDHLTELEKMTSAHIDLFVEKCYAYFK